MKVKVTKGIRREIDSLVTEIRQHRKSAGFTQESLAEALNVSTETISRIEQGTRDPSLGLFLMILEKLNLKLKLSSTK